MEFPLLQWGSVLLIHTDRGGCAQRTREPGGRGSISVGKGAAMGVWCWQLLETRPCFSCFFSVCLNLTNKPSVGNHQFSLSACHTVQSFNWESLVLIMPTCCLLLPRLPPKYPEAQDAGAPTLPHSKHPDHGLTLCIIQWPDNQSKNVRWFPKASLTTSCVFVS